MLQIFAIIKGTSVMNFGTNPQHDFPKMRGRGQRPFGTFPKIHPFWEGDASLSCEISAIKIGPGNGSLTVAQKVSALPRSGHC